jgi:L-ribulose-5-phosphate 4-epimerase
MFAIDGPLSMSAEIAAKVAATCRLLHMEGILNYSGHVSARLPRQAGFLIHPLDVSRADITAADLLALDLDLVPLPGSPPARAPLETFIHSEIYRVRPDVQAIAHTHSELAAAFTLADTPLQLMRAHAARWADGIPIHPDPTHIDSAESGRALAETLGRCHAALLRAHGGVVVAESIEALLVDAVHFDENARAHVQAAAIGPLLPLTTLELERLADRSNRNQHVRKLWAYYVGLGVARHVLPASNGLC